VLQVLVLQPALVLPALLQVHLPTAINLHLLDVINATQVITILHPHLPVLHVLPTALYALLLLQLLVQLVLLVILQVLQVQLVFLVLLVPLELLVLPDALHAQLQVPPLPLSLAPLVYQDTPVPQAAPKLSLPLVATPHLTVVHASQPTPQHVSHAPLDTTYKVTALAWLVLPPATVGYILDHNVSLALNQELDISPHQPTAQLVEATVTHVLQLLHAQLAPQVSTFQATDHASTPPPLKAQPS
jgi:hypothetical protein